MVETEVQPELLHRVSLLVTRDAPGWRVPASCVLDERGRAEIALTDDADMDLTLLLDEHAVHFEHFSRLPLARPGVRERSVAWLEGSRGSLTRDGISQAQGPDANAFERSVVHLLGVAGFSSFWWGPNRQDGKPKMPMPQDTADCLAFSYDDAVVALVECTVKAPLPDKAFNLVNRAQQLRRELRSAIGTTAPHVVPVLAAARHRDDIADSVRELCNTDGLVMLSGDALEALHDLVRAGASDNEIRSALPEALRAREAATRLFSRMF